jgi:hypothetical protein
MTREWLSLNGDYGAAMRYQYILMVDGKATETASVVSRIDQFASQESGKIIASHDVQVSPWGFYPPEECVGMINRNRVVDPSTLAALDAAVSSLGR